MESTYIYMLLGVISVLILIILLVFVGIMLYSKDSVLKHKVNQRHASFHFRKTGK